MSGAVVHADVIYTAGIVAPSVLTGAPAGIAEQAAEVLDLLGDLLRQAGGESMHPRCHPVRDGQGPSVSAGSMPCSCPCTW
jgi:enamine deaminase RidA (YjgF/YER057c/UK114 family)